MVLPVGFHCTALRSFKKYRLELFWNNIPDAPYEKLKVMFKKQIWLYHWIQDVSTARLRDSPFCMTFLKSVPIPIFPNKTNHFMKQLLTTDLPNSALSSILRFWMTPSRRRICPCGVTTENLAKHLLFSCHRTRALINCYQSKLSPDLRLTLHPNTFSIFLSQMASSADNLTTFNHVIGKFDYPKY